MFQKGLKVFLLPLLTILLAFGVYSYLRPVPQVTPVSQIASVPKTEPAALPWPAGGQAALGAANYGLLASNNSSGPVPIASIAKVITAIAVVQKYPLAAGAQGPTITLDSTDVGFFNQYYSKDGSVAPVAVGEQITELQALQTMLLPSANNIADSLARWAFGSVDAYTLYAGQLVKSLGLNNTTVGDTNGFSDTTTSTANDLVKLGIAAINIPAVAQVVSQSTAQVPVAGTVKNLNFLLGSNGVVGIKTGNTDKAGGCYLFAADRNINGHSIKLVGAILNQPDLNNAVRAAQPLIAAADSGFQQVTVVHKNQIMGYYQTAWGTKAQFKSPKDLSLFVWKGKDIKILNEPDSVSAPLKTGAGAGTVSVQSGTQTTMSSLQLSQDLPGPSWTWRLFH